MVDEVAAAGQGECERAVALLEEEARRLRHGRLKLRLMPAALYAGLPAAQQLAALNPAPRGYRKASLHPKDCRMLAQAALQIDKGNLIHYRASALVA